MALHVDATYPNANGNENHSHRYWPYPTPRTPLAEKRPFRVLFNTPHLIGTPLEQLNTKMLRRNDELGQSFPNDRLEFAIACAVALSFLGIGALLAWMLK